MSNGHPAAQFEVIFDGHEITVHATLSSEAEVERLIEALEANKPLIVTASAYESAIRIECMQQLAGEAKTVWGVGVGSSVSEWLIGKAQDIAQRVRVKAEINGQPSE